VSTNEKNTKWVKRGHVGSRDPLVEFWDPLNISGTFDARSLKFGTETGTAVSTKEENAKLGQKGSCRVT